MIVYRCPDCGRTLSVFAPVKEPPWCSKCRKHLKPEKADGALSIKPIKAKVEAG